MECYSTLTKEKILTHATTWMYLGDIMLSEISQTQKDSGESKNLSCCLIGRVLVWDD